MGDTWHILGVGSIGGLFAHRLSEGGARVRLLNRDPACPDRTLSYRLDDAILTKTYDCEWTGNVGPLAYVLLTTKSWAAGPALRRIQHRLTDKTVIVAMMNGMRHIADIKALAPSARLVLASTTAGCHQNAGYWVTAGAGKTLIGNDRDTVEPAWLTPWVKGVPALRWSDTMTTHLLEKVAINACINPLTALHNVPNGALLNDTLKAQTDAVIDEVARLLNELGHTKLASSLAANARSVIEDTATNTSSMRSDVLAGRKTEADSILGWLLEQSSQPLPKLRELANQLQSLEPS